MEHAVTEDTVIIPVMNGVDPGDRIRNLLGKGNCGRFADLYRGIRK